MGGSSVYAPVRPPVEVKIVERRDLAEPVLTAVELAKYDIVLAFGFCQIICFFFSTDRFFKWKF